MLIVFVVVSALGGVLVVGGLGVEAVVLPAGISSTAITFLVLGAILSVLAAAMGGAVLANWPLDRVSKEAKRPVTVAVVVVAALELLGLAAIVTAGVLGALPAWLVAVDIVALLAYAGILLRLGLAVLRRSRLRPEQHGPIPTDLVRRWRRRTITSGGIGFVVCLVAIGAVVILTGLLARKPAETWPLLLEPVALGLMVAGITSLFTVLGPLRSAGAELGGDYAVRRRIVRAVRRGTEILDSEEQVRAARYAAWMALLMPLQQSASIGVSLGAVINFLALTTEHADSPLRVVLVLVVLATLAFVIPVAVVQIRRVRRYASAHPVPAA